MSSLNVFSKCLLYNHSFQINPKQCILTSPNFSITLLLHRFDLCVEFLTRYGQKLEKILTEKQLLNLGSASTYDEMVSNLLLPIIGTEGMTYLDFQKEGTSSVEERQNIDRPTLLMFSLDDPLHNPNQLGINVNEIENKDLPENLCYMVTEEGGHVSFPTHVSGRSDLLRSTVVEWSNFCLQ